MEFQMTSGLQPELLNEKQKKWLATAICGAVTADGSIAPEEVEYLERALGFLRSQTEVNAMLQAVKDQKLPSLESRSSHKVIGIVIFFDKFLAKSEADWDDFPNEPSMFKGFPTTIPFM